MLLGVVFFFPYYLQGSINRELGAGFLMSLAYMSHTSEVLLKAVVCDCVSVRID